jgi:hypothetical protein
MSAESSIQLPPDSTGKRARTIAKTIGGVEVHQEVNVLGSPRFLRGAYSYASVVVAGSTTAGYVYHVLFYPATATGLVAIRRIFINHHAIAAAVYIEMAIYRITGVTGGTARAVTAVNKKDTTYPDPVIDIRDTGPTVTLGPKVFNYMSPAAAGQTLGIIDLRWPREDGRDDLILRPGQGIALRQEAAGDADFRVFWTVEWEEFTGVPVVL